MHRIPIFLFIFFSYKCKIIVLKQSYCKYKKRLLLRSINSFKSDLNGPYAHFGYWTLISLLALHLLESFIWGREWKSSIQIGGWSYIERSERSCIRNRSRVGRAERGLVSRKDGGRSGRAGLERRCIRDTARVQRVLIGDRYALQSEWVIFYPIIPDQGIKFGRHWSQVGRLSGVNVALV